MASTQASSSNPSKKIKLTIIPPRQLFVDLSSEEYDTTTPSLITKSSSLSPPNAPSKTPSTKDTSSTFDITLSLSPITLLDHILDTPSLPSPQPLPQPPLIGLGFDSSKVSTSGTKPISFIGSSAENATDRSTIKVHGYTIPGSVCLRTSLEPDEWIKDSGCSKHMTGNKSSFSTYRAYNEGNVVLGSNLKGKIIGKVKQIEDGIFFNQSKYIKEMLKKFELEDSKPMKIKLAKEDEADFVDCSKYQDADITKPDYVFLSP
nr:integrase, catalytic region, zinc finger, CCHC-type, peptidase aspartic, catalytic [Tanacetum cinerariifolium]